MHIKSVSLLKVLKIVAVVGTFAVFFAVEATFNTGCLPKSNPQGHIPPTATAVQNVVTFATNRLAACVADIGLLDVQSDPTGGHDPVTSRSLWLDARKQYEQERFAAEEFAPTFHQSVAAWFTPAPPKGGFHYIETLLFGANATNPMWTSIEPSSQSMYASVGSISSNIKSSNVTDSGIFAGLEYMLADIDSIKFSGYDTAYSNNSYNDIFSNYDGLDSVYGFYRSIVQDSSAATDTMFTSRLNSARIALQNAGSLAALNKSVYRTNYLYPLDTAVKRVAQAVGVKLP